MIEDKILSIKALNEANPKYSIEEIKKIKAEARKWVIKEHEKTFKMLADK